MRTLPVNGIGLTLVGVFLDETVIMVVGDCFLLTANTSKLAHFFTVLTVILPLHLFGADDKFSVLTDTVLGRLEAAVVDVRISTSVAR